MNSPDNIRYIFIIIFFLVTFSITASGQQWIVYDTDNSDIPHNTIRTIVIDEGGAKWIATQNGLAVFDDGDWTIYNTDNSALPHNNIWEITIDEHNVKWIGTSNGLASYDETEWRVWDYWNTPLPFSLVRAIVIDNDGNKWVGGGGIGGGLAKFDGDDWTVYTSSNSNLPDDDIRSLAMDKEGNLWIGTNWEGMAIFDGAENWTVYTEDNSDLPNNRVISLTIDNDNMKWIGTHRGMVRIDGEDWTIYTEENSDLPNNQVWTVAVERNSVQWIGTLWGMARFEGTEWTVYHTWSSGLPWNNVREITVDEEGLKWIGTDFGGVAVYKEVGVITVPDIVRLVSPTDSLAISTDSVQFVWNQSEPNVERYHIQVSTDNEFTEMVTDTSVTDTMLIVWGLHDATYWWRVSAENSAGMNEFCKPGIFQIIVTSVPIERGIPDLYVLYPNYPNPFNPSTTIQYDIPVQSHVRLSIYNVLGQIVDILVDEVHSPGFFQSTWNAFDLSGGMYFYRIEAGEYVQTRKMMLLH